MASTMKIDAHLEWTGDLRFHAESGGHELALDGDGIAGPSPMQALVLALGGCMGIDVVHILGRMRTPPLGIAADVSAERAPDDPKRFVAVDLTYRIRGSLPARNVDRALDLSREKYCSVWHSLQPDIELRVSASIEAE